LAVAVAVMETIRLLVSVVCLAALAVVVAEALLAVVEQLAKVILVVLALVQTHGMVPGVAVLEQQVLMALMALLAV
jgi:hypothetical protein